MRPPDLAALASWIGEKANARAAAAANHCLALSCKAVVVVLLSADTDLVLLGLCFSSNPLINDTSTGVGFFNFFSCGSGFRSRTAVDVVALEKSSSSASSKLDAWREGSRKDNGVGMLPRMAPPCLAIDVACGEIIGEKALVVVERNLPLE